MELKNIHIFVLCTRYLSFSKVAEITYTSQSSVSKAIAELEAEVGGELFLRSSRKMKLTSLGEALLPYAEALLSKEEEMRGFLYQYHNGKNIHPLVVGIAKFLTATPMESLLLPLTEAIDGLHRLHSDVDVKLSYFEDQQLQDLLTTGRIDLAITAVNNKHLLNQIFTGADFLRLNEVGNYLLYSPDSDPVSSLDELLLKINCLFSVSDQIALSVAYDFLQEVKKPLRIETCDNWSEVIVKVKNGQGGTILGEVTARVGRQCGLSAFPLTTHGSTSSLLAVWKHSAKHHLVEDAAILLQNAFKDHSASIME